MIHSVKQHLLRNWPGSGSCDLSQLLVWKILKSIHLCERFWRAFTCVKDSEEHSLVWKILKSIHLCERFWRAFTCVKDSEEHSLVWKILKSIHLCKPAVLNCPIKQSLLFHCERAGSAQKLIIINNDNVHLSCAHQCSERSHDTC